MSANPGTYNFTIYKGTTFSRVFTYKDSTGALIDLTGYTATFTAKPSTTYGTNAIALTGSPGIVLGGTAGTITLTIDATTTGALTDDLYVYSLRLTSASGIVSGLIKGTITVSNEAF